MRVLLLPGYNFLRRVENGVQAAAVLFDERRDFVVVLPVPFLHRFCRRLLICERELRLLNLQAANLLLLPLSENVLCLPVDIQQTRLLLNL